MLTNPPRYELYHMILCMSLRSYTVGAQYSMDFLRSIDLSRLPILGEEPT